MSGVVVDGHHTDNSSRLVVAGEQHRPGPYTGRVPGVRQRGPAKTIVVLGVEVGYQVDVVFHRSAPLHVVSLHGRGWATAGARSAGAVQCHHRGR